jgi:hypothetical protein
MKHLVVFLAASFLVAGCDNPVSPRGEQLALARPTENAGAPLTAKSLFERYVALGTSNSMGVQSAGIFAAGQRAAWPAQLAARVGVPFSLPLEADPGCGPPLLAPLAADAALVGAFGNDLVTTVMTTCAPLQAGVMLPANNVAISGADVHDALFSTIASQGTTTRTGVLYSRVLLPGQTQVAAMLAQRPTFVSVELAANDVLPASTGRISAMTPYADWERDYDAVLAAIKTSGARAVLVGLPSDAANFPSIRRARDLFNEWPSLLALGVTVSLNCYLSSNYVFVPGYVLTLLSKTPSTATCADVPGAADYVLTASDISAINARMAQMNAHMRAKATENGYAYFSLDAIYGLAKPRFSVSDLLFSNNPFGAHISLDGVHPSALGQSLIAAAAAGAVGTTYGVSIPAP